MEPVSPSGAIAFEIMTKLDRHFQLSINSEYVRSVMTLGTYPALSAGRFNRHSHSRQSQ
jgi:hypothetical protein